MSSGFDKIINNLLQILQEAGKNKTTPLDAQAEVRRVEGNTAWVHIAGGVDETPVRLTINARVGDKVQVRLSGGRAWITGNASAPPTDDHLANTANIVAKTANVTANQALQGADTAQNTADKAQSSADKAQNTATEAAKTADNYISTDSTGIMVSENKGATKETPSNATKNNVLITEKDVQIRNGQKTVASYGDITIIGNEKENCLRIDNSGIDIWDVGESLIKISRNEEKTPEITNDLVKVTYDAESDSYIAKSTYMVSDTITEEDVQLYGFEYAIDGMPSSGSHQVLIRQQEYGMQYELLTDANHIIVKMNRSAWVSWCEGALHVSDAEELTTVKMLMVYTRLHNGATLTMGKRSSDEQFDQLQGENSISVGEENVAGNESMVLGEFSDATENSIAVGRKTSAAYRAIAVGNEASASGSSAAIGYKVHTSEANQLVIGERNDSATALQDDSAAFIIGNGKDPLVVEFAEESNAAVITKKGNLRLSGDAYINCNNDSTGGVPLGTTISGTGTATATTGRIKSQPRWWRCGNIVQMEFTVATNASVASGSNIATGKITGVPRPVTLNGLRSVSYYGDNANVTYVSKDGGFTTRNCGKDALASGNDAIGSFTYITDGTML
jgi:hypothetical protein